MVTDHSSDESSPTSEVTEVHPGILCHQRKRFTVYTLDGDNTPEMQDKIREILAKDTPEALAIHVHRSRHLNSRFVGLLILLYKEMLSRKRRYVLLNPNDRMRDLILIMNLHDEFEIVTQVLDLPPSHLGISCTGPESVEGFDQYLCRPWVILSLSGPLDPSGFDRLLQRCREIQEPLAIHFGSILPLPPQMTDSLVELFQWRENQDLPTRLFQPNLHLHNEIRKNRQEERLTFCYSISELTD
ncbi:MAG: STAS domain-containing protein [Planctomycetota bacterium]|nr:STAS domain-containing protein [Planctomycetota bacterium]